MTVDVRPSTSKTTLGESRHWLQCPDCAFEHGPFSSVDTLIYWEVTRGRFDGPSLISRWSQELKKKGLPIPWEQDGAVTDAFRRPMAEEIPRPVAITKLKGDGD